MIDRYSPDHHGSSDEMMRQDKHGDWYKVGDVQRKMKDIQRLLAISEMEHQKLCDELNSIYEMVSKVYHD